MKKISIIVPVFNTPAWFEACLKSIRSSDISDDLELITVLNTSSENIRRIAEQYGSDNILEMECNVGAAMAMNEGAQAASCDIIAFVHTDTLVSSSTFSKLYERLLRKGPEVIGVIPVTNYANEMSLRVSNELLEQYTQFKPCNKSIATEESITALLSNFYSSLNCSSVESFAKEIEEKNRTKYTVLGEISHFCLMLKKAEFINNDMFDPDFFPTSYFEKIFYDKAIKSGKEIHVERGIYVHHNGNTTSDFYGFDYSKILEENKKLFTSKQQEIMGQERQNALRRIQERRVAPRVTPEPQPAPQKTALFIRSRGLGDIIMTIPSVDKFREMNPDWQITYMANSQYRELCSAFGIDNFIPNDTYVDDSNYEQFILDNSKYSTQFGKVVDWTFCPETSPYQKTESRVSLFASKAGFKSVPPLRTPKLERDDQVDSLVRGSKKIAFAYEATCSARTMDREFATTLCETIAASDPSIQIYVVGNSERIESDSNQINDLGTSLTLKQLLYLIDCMDAVISTDTGILHIAAAVKKPTVAIFGSIPPNLRTSEYTHRIEAVYQSSIYTSCPCFDVGCCGRPCLNAISIDEVKQKIGKLLNE